MPWVRRSHDSNRFYWIIAGIGAVMAGILSGYSWWGDTAAVVSIVEQQLGQSQAQVRMLERRVKALEVKLGIESEEPSASASAY